jgi:hypothetical protein
MTIELLGPEPENADARDAARYRWLRDGNAYVPEELSVTGGEELDRLCDDGIHEQEQPITQEEIDRIEVAYQQALKDPRNQFIADLTAMLTKESP